MLGDYDIEDKLEEARLGHARILSIGSFCCLLEDQ